jgi:hypothetical protein
MADIASLITGGVVGILPLYFALDRWMHRRRVKRILLSPGLQQVLRGAEPEHKRCPTSERPHEPKTRQSRDSRVTGH